MVNPNKLRSDDVIWVYVGKEWMTPTFDLRTVAFLGIVARSELKKATVVAIGPYRGREGCNTQIRARLESNGQQITARAANVLDRGSLRSTISA
jgi:hypothetical protein